MMPPQTPPDYAVNPSNPSSGVSANVPGQLSIPPGLEGPPLRQSAPRSTLAEDLQQGLEYVLFVWRISRRIRGWHSRFRFVLGLILWKPFLPKNGLD